MGIIEIVKDETKNTEQHSAQSIEEEKRAQKRKEFAIKVNIIATQMRKAGSSEAEINEYLDQIREEFEKEMSLSREELADKRRQQLEESITKAEKLKFQQVLEIYFQRNLEYDREHQTEEEFEKTKIAYIELIKKMLEMTPEELEIQYDIIGKAKIVYYDRYNRHTMFKDCLDKEVNLKVASGVLKTEDIEKFRKNRINDYLNGKFDYPDILTENVFKSIISEWQQHPERPLKIVDLDTMPGIRTELEEIRMFLEGQKQEKNYRK